MQAFKEVLDKPCLNDQPMKGTLVGESVMHLTREDPLGPFEISFVVQCFNFSFRLPDIKKKVGYKV